MDPLDPLLGSLRAAPAVVTGVSGRLGRVWTAALLRSGADVLGLDRLEPADEVAKELAGIAEQESRTFLFHHGDVTDRASLREALVFCVERLGTPRVLVNNAGIDQPPSAGAGGHYFEDIPDELSAAVLDVNAAGTLRACQVFGSQMAAQGRGSIVNIGSLYGSVAPQPALYEHLGVDPPFLKPPAYGMSKAGVVSLTRYLATLWGPDGVRVNTLSPGGVLGGQDPLFQQKFTARVPMNRMAVEEDLVGPLLFLASDMSRYITGSELHVDGGFTAW
ncbi:SDR family oxidoreductase [Streptomyces oryzae]|uniref:SDR family oxidoreductase n=1 Tax=Streptomyces oryzae TaxID=1434886 RepID=A0ABS3XJC5_9ACTN|nr:SDR family oxidoreductase [Streptomyces oryzae]MBO8195406.1 SDR family oxidoreductase [Streptomyces oryzae]